MLKKILIRLTIVVLMLSVMGVSCAPTAPTELKPVEIELSSAIPLFGGTESITILPLFRFSNPNDFPVTISSVDYTLSADGEVIGASQLGKMYISPKMDIEVKDAVVITFGDLVATTILGTGLSAGEAVGKVLPFWKALGGLLPIDAMKPKWDAMPEKKPLFEVKGTAYLTSEAGEKTIPFKLQWQES